ncbi:uncharacterized protein LOC122993417 isoform X3 [Thunnus albacares]|uniref:uncharacterized protein LOC122993417 isoform X2 n=1 Tax=Thunnus albacares TaxID=8236 RepID=UPI001CF64261|nr:uncharacterized protein LOC122993417 isoform X2 [Thunnus albacares]XP_044223501.1 uncharacterized protein LOC122993417 isoform X3 [Thunnus albacares]
MTCILVIVKDYILLLLHLCLISSSERYKRGLPLAFSPSAMDRGVLLVLLCLQAFLLITAFTSTDAATLVKDDQQQQSTELVKRFRLPKHPAEEVVLKTRGCADLPGGCGFLVKRFRLPKNPAEEVVLKKRGCADLPGGCGFLVKRGTSQQTARKKRRKRKGGCRRRPGACNGLDQ